MRSSSTDVRSAMPVLIDRWVRDGLINEAQAERMRADLGLTSLPTRSAAPATQDRRERTSLVVEALAYLGGVIVLIAAGLLTAQYWSSLSDGTKLGLVGGASTLLLLAGLAVPQHLGAASVRLRSVLWVLSTVGAAAFLALAGDLVLDLHGAAIPLLAGSGAAMLAAVLWWRARTFAQQTTFFVALMVSAGAAVEQLTENELLQGLAVWGVGVLWFVLGWRRLVMPRRAVFPVSAVGALAGTAMTLPADTGIVLALCTLGAVAGLAVYFRDLLLLAVGAVGALNILPSVITEWFPGELAAPLVLLGVGALLVAAAVYTARSRRNHDSARPR